MPTPTFSLNFAKVSIGILVIDFQGNIFMSSDKFQNLQNKFLFNLRRQSSLYDLPFQSYVYKLEYTTCESTDFLFKISIGSHRKISTNIPIKFCI